MQKKLFLIVVFLGVFFYSIFSQIIEYDFDYIGAETPPNCSPFKGTTNFWTDYKVILGSPSITQNQSGIYNICKLASSYPFPDNKGEGLYIPYGFKNNHLYDIEFHIKSGTGNVQFVVDLANNLNETSYSECGEEPVPNFTDIENIINERAISGNLGAWYSSHIFDYKPTKNYSYLMFYSHCIFSDETGSMLILYFTINDKGTINEAPSVPTGLSASAISESSFTLSWQPSTDLEGDAISYLVYKDGALLTTTSGTSCNVSGLSPCTTYSMTVKAKDSNGNTSGSSSTLPVTTTCCITDITLISPTNDISSITKEYLASNSITASNKILNNANVHYGANTRVRLSTGFMVSRGCHFLADKNGCTLLKSTKILIENEENTKYNEISVFPNPTKDFAILNFEGIEGKKQVIVYTMSGSVVGRFETCEDKMQIDFNGYRSGVYIIHVLHQNGTRILKVTRK